MTEQGVDLHVEVPPTLEHGLSRRALIGKPKFLCHALGGDIPFGNDELHPVDFRTLKEIIHEQREGFSHDALSTMVWIKHVVADFQPIKIRDGLEEPNAAHDLLCGVDDQEASVVLTPESCLVELPFERGFCRDMEGHKVAAIGNVC